MKLKTGKKSMKQIAGSLGKKVDIFDKITAKPTKIKRRHKSSIRGMEQGISVQVLGSLKR